MKIVMEIIFNLGTITSFGIVSSLVKHSHRKLFRMQLFHGLIFGIGTLIGMLQPVVLGPGLIFDGRSILISLSGLYFGPLTAMVAGSMALILRLFQGGVGVRMGVFSIMVSALIGMLFHNRYKIKYDYFNYSMVFLLLFGILVHFWVLMGALLLPREMILATALKIGPSMMIIYPLATIFLGKILSLMLSRNAMLDELKTSEALLNSSQHLTKAGGWEFDLLNNTMVWTRETYLIHGMTPPKGCENHEKLIELSSKCYYPRERELVLKAFDDCRKNGTPYDFEVRFRSFDGKEKWIKTNAIAQRDDHGNIIGVIGNILDITERKLQEAAVHEKEMGYQKLFSSMQEGFAYHKMIYDQDHQAVDYIFLDVNSSFEHLTGTRKEEILGKKASDAFHFDKDAASERMRKYTQVADTGESILFENYCRSLDKWFLISAYSNKPGFFATLIHDVTKQKQAENKLLNLNNELEDEVIKRTQDFLQSNRALEAFSYSVSHDLRAPLRAIHGFSTILLEDYGKGKQLDDEGLRLLTIIRENVANMDALINGLLSMSRVSKSELKKTIFNTRKLVDQCVADLLLNNEHDKVSIEIGQLPETYGDPVLMKQVWYNLIHNALKFSRNQAQSNIVISGIQKEDEVEFEVRDNGVGFSSEYKNNLFKTFQRLHHASEFEGTGIGLALVERIVLRHGGRIWAESELQQGARFFVALPKK